MKEELSKIVTNAPAAPGVYLMKDREGKVIYVGKANNLRSRVGAYFRGTDSRYMAPFLVSRVNEVEFIVTETEKEALILENTLIKEYRPRYNVIFRDDKTYFYIMIDPAASFPRFQLVRRAKKDGARYFGPYPSSAAAKETLRFLQSAFPLRTCRDQELKSRKRPCLEYEIRRCTAPCVGRIDVPSYRRLVKDSMTFMKGYVRRLIAGLRTRMKEASEKLRYEEAASFRDRIAAIEETLEKQRAVSMSFRDRDIFGVYREGNLTQVCVLYVRKGKIIGKSAIPVVRAEGSSSGIISSLVKQYYDGDVYIPEEIIIPENIEDRLVIKDWLSEKKGKSVNIMVPRKGERMELLRIAGFNAGNVFKTERQVADPEETLMTLALALNLKNIPHRMECFDISNISGNYAVGSMVTFWDGRPWKKGYRRFRIRTVPGADDYAMIYEVMSRRYSRKDDIPDLIVVDGGKGQLQVALTVLKDLNIEGVDVIGLAKEGRGGKVKKDEDRVYLPGKKEPLYLSKWPEALFLLQKVRDEAHRFAVLYHHRLKEEQDFMSVLDTVHGVGALKKKALLRFFGDIETIRQASVEELQKATGIGMRLAKEIDAVLREPAEGENK